MCECLFLAAKPLENLLPVDEFLPIMFDQHQITTWKKTFPNRNLVAWSAAQLLLFPTHYTGDQGYSSDTEQSDIINVTGKRLFETMTQLHLNVTVHMDERFFFFFSFNFR